MRVQFEYMVNKKKVGIPMGTNCAPLIADLFICYERDFMSNLHKSKQYDLIYMFNDTSRYLDDIFTIDNPEFGKHIPDIRGALSIFVPSLSKARSTTLIFVERITFHQTKFLDDKQFSPAISYVCGIILSIPVI